MEEKRRGIVRVCCNCLSFKTFFGWLAGRAVRFHARGGQDGL
jgi:hypothetical protein